MRLSVFFATFSILYGSLHLYAFLRAKRALLLGGWTNFWLILFMVIMVFSPALVRILERSGFERLPRVMAYVGYTWMGLLFLFVSASLVVDAGITGAVLLAGDCYRVGYNGDRRKPDLARYGDPFGFIHSYLCDFENFWLVSSCF